MNFFFRVLILNLFLILIYIIYKSEIYWEGSKRSYYLTYYIGNLLAIFFSIIFLYLNVKIKKYIIIIFISTIFTFYSFEGILIFNSKKNLNYERKSIFEEYNDLKKTNLNVTIASPTFYNYIHSKETNLLNLAGISKTKTIFCNENGYYSIYQSDRYGFNNPDKEWDSKEIEYFLIGDSFTHGACVNRPNDIGSVLRQYSKKNVLNLGQQGNGPLLEYATLREYLLPNIKNVLWLYFEGNDLIDLNIELKNDILNKYLTNPKFKQDLKIKQTEIDQFITNFVEREIESQNTEIVKFIKLHNIRSLLLKRVPPQSLPPLAELKVILNLANQLIESYDGKLYFIYLPDFHRYKESNLLKKNNEKEKIKKIVIDLGIKFIDIDEEVFKKEKNPLKLFPFEQNGHYTVNGYKKVALKIFEKTKSN